MKAVKTGPEEEHHPLGPSALKHVEICPGYRSASEETVFTIEGTLLHEACETRDLSKLSQDQKPLVESCLEYVDELSQPKNVKSYIERKLKINLFKKDEEPPDNAVYTKISGTGDLLLVNEDTNHIDLVDYKFGRGEIDCAAENIQGQAYFVGAMDLFETAKSCQVHFIIPRRGEITTHTYTRDELEDIRFRLRIVVEKATQPEPELNPRTETCRFCKNRLSCPELRQNLLPIAQKHINNNFAVDVLKKYSPSEVSDPEILSRMVQVAPVMEKWAQEAKKHAAQVAMETGDAIPGFQLRYRNAQKRLTDTAEVSNVMNLEFGIGKLEFTEACTPVFSKLVDILARSKKLSKVAARAELELALTEAKLLPDSDKQTPYLVKK
jgi:hypothetical protein